MYVFWTITNIFTRFTPPRGKYLPLPNSRGILPTWANFTPRGKCVHMTNFYPKGKFAPRGKLMHINVSSIQSPFNSSICEIEMLFLLTPKQILPFFFFFFLKYEGIKAKFTSLSALFRSYQDDWRVIKKGSVQWSAVQSWAEFWLPGDLNPWPCEPVRNTHLFACWVILHAFLSFVDFFY